MAGRDYAAREKGVTLETVELACELMRDVAVDKDGVPLKC